MRMRVDVVNLPFSRYSVAPDGQRFPMLTPPANVASNTMMVTLNWLATKRAHCYTACACSSGC